MIQRRWMRRMALLALPAAAALAGAAETAAGADDGHTLVAHDLNALSGMLGTIAPGTTVLLSDGEYATKKPFRIEGLRGTAEAPITLRAEHRGRAVIAGAAGLVLKDCERLVLEGLTFANDADQPAVLLDNCRHVRVTRNVFRLREREKPRHMEHWVYVIGAHSGTNRIDRNLFERKTHSGSMLFVRGDDAALACSQHDRLDHNHFRDFAFAKGSNGFETVRTGGNDLGASGRSSFTVIEDNLLERCSGESEVMSIKSSDNIVRHNTLTDSYGGICLRLGNRNEVSGNFILADGIEPGRGGVKLYGCDHRVFNNYFQGLTGTKHEAPLALIPGTFETPTTDRIGKQYDDLTTVPPTRAWIAFNTWIDCAPLQFGFRKDERRVHTPLNCAFVNNLVVRTKPQSKPLVNLELIRNLKTRDNLAWTGTPAPEAAVASWFRFADPHLRREDGAGGLWRLTESSPAVDAVGNDARGVIDDLFGRPRSGRPDIGAEEFTDASAIRRPLTPADVGPDAP